MKPTPRKKRDISDLYNLLPAGQSSPFYCRKCGGDPGPDPINHVLTCKGHQVAPEAAPARKSPKYLKIDAAKLYVSGTYGNGQPRIMIRLDDLGLVVNMPHRDRAGTPCMSTTYQKAVLALIDAGVSW